MQNHVFVFFTILLFHSLSLTFSRREKKLSRSSALKVLNFAMTGPDGGDNCNKFVEILGLRSLFPLFMKVIYWVELMGHILRLEM